MRRLISFVVAAGVAVGASAALAQPFPNRPIRLVVAFPPGGATDVIARTVGTPLGIRLGQTVVVDNRPGSNGNLAAEVAAKAKPDGYTLMIGSDSLFGINPHIYEKMPVDPAKDFVPIANLVANQLVLAVNPAKVPATDLRGFVDFIKKSPTKLFYASIGNGSQHHLAMEMLKMRAGVDLTHVPYKGGGPAAIAVVSGEVVAMFGGGSVVPLVKSGKMRALAVSSRERSSALPDVPAIAEVYPGYEVGVWQGLFAPAGTPREIVDKLRTETVAVLEQKEIADRLIASGSGDPSLISLNEWSATRQRDYDNYGKVIKSIGLKVDD